MTREELNDSIDLNVTDRTEENPSSAPLIGGEIKKVADYVDQKGQDVVLKINRASGGAYTVTNVLNNSGITFTASDISSTGVGLTASSSFFINGKVFPDSTWVHNSGNPYVTYDGDFTSSTLRAVWFYFPGTQTAARPSEFTILVKYTVYP